MDCKSVFKVLSLSTEMQFSTDLALMSTKSMYYKLIKLSTNDKGGGPWYLGSYKGKPWNLVSLTNLFETLYPRL